MDHALPKPAFPVLSNDEDRRTWLIATSAAGAVAAVATAVPFVSTFAPSERAKAMGAPVEVDISDIPPGGTKTVEWRGKPVWVVRRTPEMLAALQGHDAQLVDPQSERTQQPDYARNAARANFFRTNLRARFRTVSSVIAPMLLVLSLLSSSLSPLL